MKEDGVAILYKVLKDDYSVGSFKVLSLGIEEIKRYCNANGYDISRYKIILQSTGDIVWHGKLED